METSWPTSRGRVRVQQCLVLLLICLVSVVSSTHRITVYRNNQTIAIPCKAFNTAISRNGNSEDYLVEWFGPNNENATLMDGVVKNDSTLHVSVTAKHIGWYTCVVYSKVNDVIAVDDARIDLDIVDFASLYKQNLIAAIIVSTSFVLIVLLVWLVWSYRWRPSPDDLEGKNSSEKKKKSSKKPGLDQLKKGINELKKRRPKGVGKPVGTPATPTTGGWTDPGGGGFVYINPGVSDSTDELPGDARSPGLASSAESVFAGSTAGLYRVSEVVEEPRGRISYQTEVTQRIEISVINQQAKSASAPQTPQMMVRPDVGQLEDGDDDDDDDDYGDDEMGMRPTDYPDVTVHTPQQQLDLEPNNETKAVDEDLVYEC